MSSGTIIFGIAAAENRDKSGELIQIRGVDDSNLRWFNDEHTEPTSMNLGYVTSHKKIFAEGDCENTRQLKCWNLVKVPFIYVEGELFDNRDHPFAKAAASIIKFAAQNPEYRVPIGLSIEGGIIERQNDQGQTDKEGKILAQTVATKATITVKPCNPKCHVFVEHDLAKSAARVQPPEGLEKLLTAPDSTSSFKDDKLVKAVVFARHLKKSIDDYRSGFTSIKCLKCGESHRFFKDSRDLPAHCKNCNFHFPLKTIWTALNR
jgi:ribosomal protein S27E